MWSGLAFSVACVAVGLSTLAVAVFLVFAGARDLRNAVVGAANYVSERFASQRPSTDEGRRATGGSSSPSDADASAPRAAGVAP